MACGAFFFTTLEEYFTDIMYFPIIHGVSEGTLCACAAMIIAGIHGGMFYSETQVNLYFIQMQLNKLMIIFAFITSNIFSLMSIFKIYRKFKGRLLEALYYAACFLFLVTSIIIVQLCYKGNDNAYITNSKVLIYCYGFAFSKLVVHYGFILGSFTNCTFS